MCVVWVFFFRVVMRRRDGTDEKTMGAYCVLPQMAAFRECWKRHGNVKRTEAQDVEGAQTKLG